MKRKILSIIGLVIFSLAFIFACLRNVLPIGKWISSTFGIVGYPVFLILAFVNALINVIRAQDIGNSVSALLDILLEIIIYFDYIQFSTNVLKELQSTSEGCCNGLDG